MRVLILTVALIVSLSSPIALAKCSPADLRPHALRVEYARPLAVNRFDEARFTTLSKALWRNNKREVSYDLPGDSTPAELNAVLPTKFAHWHRTLRPCRPRNQAPWEASAKWTIQGMKWQ